MATLNHQIVLAARPEGLPKPSDFRLVETPAPEPGAGPFLVKTNYLSVYAYMRGRISEAKSYAKPVEIGEVMVGGTVGTVVETPPGLSARRGRRGPLGLAGICGLRWPGRRAVRYLAHAHVHRVGRLGVI